MPPTLAICEAVTRANMRFMETKAPAGALAVIRYAKIHGTAHRPWLSALLARRPTKVADRAGEQARQDGLDHGQG